MRCKISRDEKKMVICTTGGYLIIVHNLDLTNFAKDLKAFKVCFGLVFIIFQLKIY